MRKCDNIWLIGAVVNSFPCHGKDRQFNSDMSRLPLAKNGGIGEKANTADCDSAMCRFESYILPYNKYQ